MSTTRTSGSARSSTMNRPMTSSHGNPAPMRAMPASPSLPSCHAQENTHTMSPTAAIQMSGMAAITWVVRPTARPRTSHPAIRVARSGRMRRPFSASTWSTVRPSPATNTTRVATASRRG
jgi:hypothetical protein